VEVATNVRAAAAGDHSSAGSSACMRASGRSIVCAAVSACTSPPSPAGIATRGPIDGAKCAAGAALGTDAPSTEGEDVAAEVGAKVGVADSAPIAPGREASERAVIAARSKSTVRSALAAWTDDADACASPCSLAEATVVGSGASSLVAAIADEGDAASVAIEEAATGAMLSAARGASLGADARNASTRASDSRAAATIAFGADDGAAAAGADDGALAAHGPAPDVARGDAPASLTLRAVTIASPDQIGERSATPGNPASATDATAPASTSAAAAAAKSTDGDHVRRPDIGSLPLIAGATASIAAGDRTGSATPVHGASPPTGLTNVPRVVIAARRGERARPWRAAAIQSSSSWYHGRGNTHDTSGATRPPVPA
jgi:hypothetical protein